MFCLGFGRAHRVSRAKTQSESHFLLNNLRFAWVSLGCNFVVCSTKVSGFVTNWATGVAHDRYCLQSDAWVGRCLVGWVGG